MVHFYYRHKDGREVMFEDWADFCRYTSELGEQTVVSDIEQRLHRLANEDATVVTAKNKEYGESWCKRGGSQAFAVIWRKVDRIESILAMEDNGYDIFQAWGDNPGNIQDDIRDLRTYLLLLEEYVTREREEEGAHPQSRGYVDQDR